MRRTSAKVSALFFSLVMLGSGAGVVLSGRASASSVCSSPCTLLGNTVPANDDAVTDNSAVELGVRFTSDVPGSVTGIRFYKSLANTGTHTGTLWTAGGSPLATATFTGESASGWQQVTFASPVPITAGATYVASYHTDTGHYAFEHGGFASSINSPPLHAPADTPMAPNGVFHYGAGGVFPTDTFLASNYSVDLTFVTTDPAPPTENSVTSASVGTASVAFTPGPDGGSPFTSFTVTCVSLSGQPTVTASGPSSPITVSGLTPDTPYVCTVTETNAVGTSGPSNNVGVVWPFAGAPRCTGGVPSAPPGVPTSAEGNASATVSWAVPLTGCVAGYVVTPYLGSVAQTPTLTFGTGTTTVVKGLINGSAYSFTVAAEDGTETGPASAHSSPITAGVPTPATSVKATRVAKGSVKVAFKAGASNGAAVTSYTATCKSSNGGAAKTKLGKANPLTVTGLTAGKTYTCTVRATNSRGTGRASARSAPVKA